MTRRVTYIVGRKSGQRNHKKKLGVGKGASWQLVGVLVMNLLDVIQGCKEDIEQLRIEVFPTMFGHEFDSVIEAEGRFVDSLCGESVEGIGDRGDPSFHGNRFTF